MKAFAKFGIDETTISVGDEIIIHASQKFTPTFHADNYISWIERHADGTIKRFATSNYNCVITEKMRVKFISMEGCENFESYTNLKGYEKTKHALARANEWVASSMRCGMFSPVEDMNLAHDEYISQKYSDLAL